MSAMNCDGFLVKNLNGFQTLVVKVGDVAFDVLERSALTEWQPDGKYLCVVSPAAVIENLRRVTPKRAKNDHPCSVYLPKELVKRLNVELYSMSLAATEKEAL